MKLRDTRCMRRVVLLIAIAVQAQDADLVMFIGCLRDERHLTHTRERLTAVGDVEAEHIGVERDHSVEVLGSDGDV